MRRKQRALKTILSAPRQSVTNDIGETVLGWGSPVVVRAAVYPLGDGISVQMYGERAAQMRRLVADKPDGLKPGNGVWTDGTADGAPPWHIVRVEEWPNHTEATMERRVT